VYRPQHYYSCHIKRSRPAAWKKYTTETSGSNARGGTLLVHSVQSITTQTIRKTPEELQTRTRARGKMETVYIRYALRGRREATKERQKERENRVRYAQQGWTYMCMFRHEIICKPADVRRTILSSQQERRGCDGPNRPQPAFSSQAVSVRPPDPASSLHYSACVEHIR
jgi:hypothetical protein